LEIEKWLLVIEKPCALLLRGLRGGNGFSKETTELVVLDDRYSLFNIQFSFGLVYEWPRLLKIEY